MRTCPSSRFRLSGGALLPFLWGVAASTSPLSGQTLYEFGNPSGDEQLYIELINRARGNPPAEGARLAATTDPDVLSAYAYFGVNLAMMQSEFNAIAAQPPLAPNALLTGTARSHSQWMLANAKQDHNETNPSNTPWGRITDAGYNYSTVAESIYAYSKSVWFGHAGFQVDWGFGGTGGMQAGRGHRVNTHNGAFREIGVGVVIGSNGSIGPRLVTQDFGTRISSPTFGTGVAYYDLNGNDFYDAGEGISGLTVNVSGASYYCATADGGGWVIPVPSSAATRTVTFSGLNVNQSTPLVLPASKNAKADLKLSYTPPAITSAASADAGSEHTLAFAAIAGATGYQWNRWNLAAAPAENCESTAGITSATSGGYTVLNTSVKQQGSASFHLQNSTGTDQSIELDGTYFGGNSPALSFQSSVRLATSSEHFKVQIRELGDSAWQDVFSQQGSNGWGESSFTLRSAALTAMTGKSFQVRFLLNAGDGYHFTNTGNSVGWFIDAISFTGVSILQNEATELLATSSGSFIPDPGTYLMAVAPVISGRNFPASYQTLSVTDPPPPPAPPSIPTFASWAAGLENDHSLPAGTLADPNGDHDHDGRSNLIEYAFGGSPVGGNDPTDRLPTPSTTATHFVLRYQRDTSLGDLTFTPQSCPVMQNWKAPGEPGAPAGFTDEWISTEGSIETREAKIPRSSGNCFLRLRISRE